MEIKFRNNGIVEINDARLVWKNFSGRGDMYNREGNRNFELVIPNQELADALINDKNEFGVGWNVKVKAPRDVDDMPFMHLNVKVKFNARGPKVYLVSGNKRITLDEDSIGMLDNIDIHKVDLDIRPYDDEGKFGPFRAAYLQSMCVVQEIDRFAARFAEEEMEY